jgi:hypothetical protein
MLASAARAQGFVAATNVTSRDGSIASTLRGAVSPRPCPLGDKWWQSTVSDGMSYRQNPCRICFFLPALIPKRRSIPPRLAFVGLALNVNASHIERPGTVPVFWGFFGIFWDNAGRRRVNLSC